MGVESSSWEWQQSRNDTTPLLHRRPSNSVAAARQESLQVTTWYLNTFSIHIPRFLSKNAHLLRHISQLLDQIVWFDEANFGPINFWPVWVGGLGGTTWMVFGYLDQS